MVRDVDVDIDRAGTVHEALAALGQGRGVLISGEPGSGRSHLVRSIVSALDDDIRRTIWVHDGRRATDETIVRRLVQSLKNGEVTPIIVTGPHRRPAPWQDEVTAEREHVILQLLPLDRTAQMAIAQRFLDGPLDPKAVPALIPRREGGDLVVLRAALRELQSSRALVRSDGSWRFAAPIPPLDDTRSLIHGRIGGTMPPGEPTETILDVIALAPELGL